MQRTLPAATLKAIKEAKVTPLDSQNGNTKCYFKADEYNSGVLAHFIWICCYRRSWLSALVA